LRNWLYLTNWLHLKNWLTRWQKLTSGWLWCAKHVEISAKRNLGVFHPTTVTSSRLMAKINELQRFELLPNVRKRKDL
jgi:hypothetical protein